MKEFPTPRPPSLQGKGESERSAFRPFPWREGTAATAAGLGLLLAPLIAATPDSPDNWAQAMGSSAMNAGIFAFVFALILTRRQTSKTRFDGPTLAFAALALLALLSIGARLTHGAAFLGPMLRSFATLAAQFSLFLLARLAAKSGFGLTLAVALSAVGGSAIVAGLGVGEFLTHFAAGEREWRIFATSTPDFLAAFFVVTLPVTLSLFLGAASANRLPFLFGIALVLQLAALLLTGSRFALVSLTLGILTFALAAWRTSRAGMTWEKSTRKRAIGLAVIVAIVGIGAARPVVNRLLRGDANSGAFRAWTWRGTVKMVEANPIFGTGIGTYVYSYPKYALTGFTRLAHNGYLQTAAETGIPALLVLVATLALIGAAGVKSLTKPMSGKTNASTASIFPADERLPTAGILGGLVAGAAQNLIDSDWSVYFFGVTFWTLAGLLAGLSSRDDSPSRVAFPARLTVIFGVVFSLILCVFTLTGGVGAWFGARGMAATNPADARSAFAAASSLDPLNGRYPSHLGFRVYAPSGDLTQAETLLRRAVMLEPSPFHFRRLGQILERQGRKSDALAAYRLGLDADPNFVDLLRLLAEKSPAPSNLDYYRRLSTMEISPIGTVRAIDGVTETAFAVADSALADADSADAPALLSRAARLLESYADERGSNRRERQLQFGGHPDPQADRDMAALYQSVMTRLERLPGQNASELERRRVDYGVQFDGVIEQAKKTGSTENP